jgi:hypothetical protein
MDAISRWVASVRTYRCRDDESSILVSGAVSRVSPLRRYVRIPPMALGKGSFNHFHFTIFERRKAFFCG